jgi:hypothetical protein
MIRDIIDALELVEFGESELIDIAKGKYKLPQNIKEFKRFLKDLIKK